MIVVILSFCQSSSFQNIFPSTHKWKAHINAKLTFSNSSSLKSVFEKLCFGDRLVRTVDLSIEIKLCSQNRVSCHLKTDHIHVCISLVPDKTRF